uniref:TIR domain-containing protein n=1 Tax=Periophthalmus magnuspinnatus TaxID=409849 RepID=A0A3B3ZAF0_9GOBI
MCFTCRITERMRALTGPVKDPVTPAPWKHHSTIPPLLKMEKKSSILSACCQRQSLLNSAARWTRPYDVFVCHSHELSDTEEAERLVSCLEAPPHNLRCFLSHRDSCPGAAIPSELCQAVQNSHIKVLIITEHFLKDEWCTYVMHQALADGPMSNRMIPLVRNLLHSDFPPELRVYSYTDLNRNTEHCYTMVTRTFLKTLMKLQTDLKA